MKAPSALVSENTGTRVSAAMGRCPARSADPAQRSSTSSPSSQALNRAPISPPSAKLAAKASRTRANRSGQWPRISITRGLWRAHPVEASRPLSPRPRAIP